MKKIGDIVGAAFDGQSGEKTPPEAKTGQSELFRAETTWFHIFRDMIESGDVAKIGPHAVTVYLVIKAHTNFSTGRAFPAIETIVEKSGVSVAQVKRELKTLEAFGYITKEKKGRHNVYTLREKVSIKSDDGRPAAVATWDYLPSSVQHAVADLKNVMISGDLAGAKLVHIERLQVNVVNLHDNAVNFNVQQMLQDLDKMPPDMRESFKKMLEAKGKARG